MSATRAPAQRLARLRKGWSGAAISAFAITMSATAANAKVTWDSTREPLLRAERLARQRNFVVHESLAPLMPYWFTPYQGWTPAFGTRWLWSGNTVTGIARACDGE